jgi:iron-sulfur cluster repair protein YtfE (RIC family)
MIDLYTTIHKGQRKTLFEISIDAGKADYTNPQSLNKLQEALVLFREEMRLHALLEEKLIHPLLAERVPRGQIKLEEDHRLMHKKLDALLQHLESLRNKPVDF